jgi:uncharacterized protein (TIGR03032 family)
MPDPTLPPFACTYSPNLPGLLDSLQCSLALSTYQAGKLIFISATPAGTLVQLARTFEAPMGLAVQGQRLAVATQQDVVVLANAPGLAADFPGKPAIYDGLYVPQAVYHTGQVSMHDLAWGTQGLWGVNTRFSCLCLIDDQFHFRPQWRPSFVSQLLPEDRCHLNGLALSGGEPAYATALATSDSAGGWRADLSRGHGVLMHVPSGAIALDGLYMPHSPRLIDGELYLLLSGTGELVRADLEKRQVTVMAKVDGFARGLACCGDILFIGLSKLRQRSATFKDLPIAKGALFCGVVAVDRRSGAIVGHIRYENSVEEIYDVQVLPNLRRPGILNSDSPEFRLALSLPETTFWGAKNGPTS